MCRDFAVFYGEEQWKQRDSPPCWELTSFGRIAWVCHFFSFRLTLSWYACLPPPPVNPAAIRCIACVKLCFVSCLTLWPDSDWVVTLFYLLLGPLTESSPLWARLSGLICCGKRACNVALHGNHSEPLHKHSISTLKRSINRGIAALERIQLHQHPKNTA